MSQSPSEAPAGRRSLSCQPEFRFWLMGGLVLIFYFIAANIGSGWIFLLCALLFTVAAASVVLPFFALSRAHVSLRGPERARANDRLDYSVDVSGSQALRWVVVRLAVGAPGSHAAVLEQPGKGCTVVLAGAPLARGVHPLPPVRLETAYPIGLAWCGITLESPGKTIVHPEILPIEGRFLLRLKSSMYVPGGSASGLAGFHSSSFRGVRDYVRGDSRRFIHWSLSARHGSLMVKEFEREGLATFDIAIDMCTAWKGSEEFELALKAAASLLAMGHSQGIHPFLYVLRKPVGEPGDVPPYLVEEDRQMDQLAELQAADAGKFKIDLTGFADRQRPVLVITPAATHDDPPPGVVLVELGARGPEKPLWEPAGRRLHIASRADFEDL